LRVRAGPSYSNLTTIRVNDEHHPFLLDSEHFTGYLVVRYLNFSGTTSTDNTMARPIHNPISSYFQGRNRRYSIMLQGRFKKEWKGDDIIFGANMASPLRTPPGASIAIRIAKWLDPSVEADLDCHEPYIYSPMVSSMNSLATLSSVPSAPLLNTVPSVDIGPWAFHSQFVPEYTSLLFPSNTKQPLLTSYDKRKRFFADITKRNAVTFSPQNIYCMDFYDAYFDFNTVSVKLPGISLSAFKFWEGQPLRYVAMSRDRSTVFFVITFELIE
ncbi:hypothetical protein BATDEDRAFT_4893, partial [Batrachochytrium dendrobatidis JAM81]